MTAWGERGANSCPRWVPDRPLLVDAWKAAGSGWTRVWCEAACGHNDGAVRDEVDDGRIPFPSPHELGEYDPSPNRGL